MSKKLSLLKYSKLWNKNAGYKKTVGAKVLKEKIIDKPELQAPLVRLIEFGVSLSFWVILIFHTVITIMAWIFGIEFGWYYLFSAVPLKATLKMVNFLVQYGVTIFLILFGWAKWNYWRYGRLNRRKQRPSISDEAICNLYKVPVDTVDVARSAKIGNIYPLEQGFNIEVVMKNTPSDAKIKVVLGPAVSKKAVSKKVAKKLA